MRKASFEAVLKLKSEHARLRCSRLEHHLACKQRAAAAYNASVNIFTPFMSTSHTMTRLVY